MKNKLLILLLCVAFLNACSWRVCFYVLNNSDKPVSVEIKLNKKITSFPIFHYNRFIARSEKKEKINYENQSDIKADTLEDYSHIKIFVPAHMALEIGQLQNDKYEKHDQYFINGRVFNLEWLIIGDGEKETKITPASFDNFFRKGKYGDVVCPVQ